MKEITDGLPIRQLLAAAAVALPRDEDGPARLVSRLQQIRMKPSTGTAIENEPLLRGCRKLPGHKSNPTVIYRETRGGIELLAAGPAGSNPETDAIAVCRTEVPGRERTCRPRAVQSWRLREPLDLDGSLPLTIRERTAARFALANLVQNGGPSPSPRRPQGSASPFAPDVVWCDPAGAPTVSAQRLALPSRVLRFAPPQGTVRGGPGERRWRWALWYPTLQLGVALTVSADSSRNFGRAVLERADGERAVVQSVLAWLDAQGG